MGIVGRNLLRACPRVALVVMVVSMVAIAGMAPQKASAAGAKQASYFVYVGGRQGIYQYRIDEKTGSMTPIGLAAEIRGAGWLATDAQHRFLYTTGAPAPPASAGSNQPRPRGRAGNQRPRGGSISSFSIDPKTGALTYINTMTDTGGGAAHISLDKTGKILFAANYGGGSVASFAIKDDGSLGAETSMDQHTGSSINPARQTGPHAHSVVVSPDNRYVFSPDLGLDKIFIYKIDTAKQTITPNDPAYVEVKPGLGPRHFAFGTSGKFAYAVCEMGAAVVTFTYDADKGIIAPIQTTTILGPDPTPLDQGSEIYVAPSGKYLYTSNQGPEGNSAAADGIVTAFQIDQKTGMVKQIQVEPTGGKEVRSFGLDPSGKYLVAGNGVSNTMVVFAIGKDGKLTPTKQVIDVSSPSSFLFVPAP